jgi:hypothetical protein
VCHRTVSGAPGRSTPNLPPLGFWDCLSAIIHQTVRCAKRSNGYNANGCLQKVNSELQCGLHAQKSEQAQMAHRTVNRTCPMHHWTVRWPHLSELQRSNPNGWVTWLAHRTVSGGAPEGPVRPSTAAFPNGHFGGWGYKYPQPPTLQSIQVFSQHIQYKI